jgi:recombination protein RecR
MLPKPVENLIKSMAALPGIGPKFAERLVFFLASRPAEANGALAKSIEEFNKKIKNCAQCGNIPEQILCPICLDPRRDKKIICVVESASDIMAIEKTGQYKGSYHVLGGLISPNRRILPENLRLKQLISRASAGRHPAGSEKNGGEKVEEIIIATNPTTEGDATALYVAKSLESFRIKTTRLARGLPSGGELEYMDETTLSSALTGRRKI